MIIEVYPGQLDFKGPQSPTAKSYRPYRAGILAITGLALTCAISVATPAGALTLSGQTPTVQNVFGVVVNTPAGSLVFKGPAAPTTVFTTAVGRVLLSGQTPNLAFAIEPPAGSLVWHGIAPDQTNTIPAGSLLWVGLPPTLLPGYTVTPGCGTLVFKGPQRPEEIPRPDVGILTYTGRVPTPQVTSPTGGDQFFQLPGTDLIWHGLAPVSAAPDKTVTVPVGSLVLSGKYIRVAFKSPDTGSLVWHGLAPIVDSGQKFIAMPAGSLLFIGQPGSITPVTVAIRRTLTAMGTRMGSRQLIR